MKTIGIRREDKNIWEKRVPLVPDDTAYLLKEHRIRTLIQSSPIRIYGDSEYQNAGAEIKEDLSRTDLILAVKEVPVTLIGDEKTYLFFTHTIKGQPYNMPMLKALMDRGCNLLDYERIIDEDGRRLIFFGQFAGIAGMIETLYAYGQKLYLQGIEHPFQRIRQAYQYTSITQAKEEMKGLADSFVATGFPVFIGISGYGNVARGAQEILDLFPHQEISPSELLDNRLKIDKPVVKIVFKEKDMVDPLNGDFDLQSYYDKPDQFKGKFHQYLNYLDILVNCIYWTEDYPRLVTKEDLRSHKDSKLKVIGDISCDINGSIEITHKSTHPDHATFTYEPDLNTFYDGTRAKGVTVMAVDNLPCEFPRESSLAFSKVLKLFIPEILNTDFSRDFDVLTLSYPLKKALILHNGNLTEDYRYLEMMVANSSGDGQNS